MENTKKWKKVVNGLVYIVVLVLIGVIVYQNHQIRKLSHALNSANESTGKLVSGQDDITQKSAPRNAIPVANRSGQDDYDDLRYQLESAEQELDMAHEQLADEIARNDENANTMMPGSITEMLKTPEGKKKLRNSLKNGYDHTYGALFKEMNLSPEKIDQLKELLADQQIASMELGNELQNASMTEKDRKNLQKQLEEQNNQNDAALAALLGSDNFETFSDYKDRSRERSMIQMFSQQLSFDDTLTGDQKTSLLESLYNKRKDTYSQLGFDEEDLNGPLDMDDDGISKFMEMNVSIYDGYIKGVEEAGLSESQEKQLKGFLEEQQAMMKKSMELQARIASGELDPESAREELESGNTIIMDY